VIIKHDHKFFLVSSTTGKILGIHARRDDAVAQERAINISKARKAGYRIPDAPRRKQRDHR
jgi:hypothetical protein